MELFHCFSLAYIIQDTICMLLYPNPLYSHLSMFHHIISMLGISVALVCLFFSPLLSAFFFFFAEEGVLLLTLRANKRLISAVNTM